MVLELLLETLDPNISPMIDLDRVSAILTNNRVNAPITDFVGDGRVNQTIGDPHQRYTFPRKLYWRIHLLLSKSLRNQQTTRFRCQSSHRTFQGEDFDLESGYTLFPGHSNVDDFATLSTLRIMTDLQTDW